MNVVRKNRNWIIKAVKVVLVVEMAYLIVFNLALWLPLTQSLVNRIKPDKFHVSWQSAWTWYPFRVHATGISANGQSRSQQWQLDTPAASASIAVLPLVAKRVWISDVVVADIDYRQRPRLKPERDYSQLLDHFPAIDGREVAPAITTPRKKRRPWHIAVENARASGSHSFWVYQARGSAEGELAADLSFATQGGAFSLDVDHLDLKLDPLYLNGSEEVFQRGVISGALGFAPFVPRQNKGVAMLEFLYTDVKVRVDVNSLAFINLFTGNFDGVSVDGAGQVNGQLVYRQGNVLSGTDLSIDAEDLQVTVLAHRIEGEGAVDLRLGPQTDELFDLSFQYRGLEVVHEGDDQPLLKGDGLLLAIGGDGNILRDPDQPNMTRSLTFTVEELAVPDLSLLEHYLPPKWPLQLYGGNGVLRGMASISPTSLVVDLALASEQADLGVRDYRFDANLDAALKLDNPSVSTQYTQVGGTYIKLTDARLRREGQDTKEEPIVPWNASLEINDGYFSLLSHSNKEAQDKAGDLLQRLGQNKGKELLGDASAELDFEANVSSLAWIGVLFGDDYNVSVGGSGGVKGALHLASGWPSAGTDVAVASDELAVNILDYVSRGQGKVTLQIDQGKQHPDWFIDIALADADFKRVDEAVASIRQVNLNLAAAIRDVDFDGELKASALNFKILSANVTDMSTFNGYLAPDGSLRFTGGTADLSADIALQPDGADGWLRLDSTAVTASIGEQSITGDISAKILLVGGVPADRQFDVSGSELRLDKVRIAGEQEQFVGADWSAVFQLPRAEVTLSRPARLDIGAKLRMSDSRPIVAVFENQGKRPEFLSKMLTIEDINGTADILIADEVLKIVNAHAISDKMEVGAKGSISSDGRDAVLYFRYKKADGLLKFQDEKKNLDVIKVREKFDAYRVAP